MTTVNAAGGSLSASASTSSTSKTTLIDPNSFLKLLVAELRYQDPTKPMDTTQLVQQLASMSEVEQAAQTNTKLAAILDQLSLSQSSALIGKTVTSADGSQSGIVATVRATSAGGLAGLADGSEMLLAQGVTVSR